MSHTAFTGCVVVIFALSGGMLFYTAASEHAVVETRTGIAAINLRGLGAPTAPSKRAEAAAVTVAPPVERTPAQKDGLGRHIQSMAGPWGRTILGIERARAVRGGVGPIREVDYSDPSGRDAAPLMLVWGADEKQLSENFRVGDFAASDGAAYARISPHLVIALEALQKRLGRSVHITSGYRHSALNHRQSILGAGESFHMSGLAADIWVENATPLEVAAAALDTLGCGIGLGLGAYFLHVDLRGWTAGWAREGAVMDEVDFDLWILDRCDDTSTVAADSAVTAIESGLTVAGAYRDEILTFAHVQRRRGRRGAVILDMRPNVPGYDTSASYRLNFAEPGNVLLRSLSLEAMLSSAERSGAFVYVIIRADGAQDVGLMDYHNKPAPGRQP